MEKIMSFNPALRWLIAIGVLFVLVPIASILMTFFATKIQSLDFWIFTIFSHLLLFFPAGISAISIRICPQPIIFGILIIVLSLISGGYFIQENGFKWNNPVIDVIFWQIVFSIAQMLKGDEDL